MVIGKPGHPVIMEEVTDPQEIAEARVRREHFDRNWEWLQAQSIDLFEMYRGRCICVSGCEIFAADTAVEAMDLARSAHPEDQGPFFLQVPREKAIRIYAC